MGQRFVTWIDGEEATVDLLEVSSSEVLARIEPADEGPVRELRFSLRRSDPRWSVQGGDGGVENAVVLASERATTVAFGADSLAVRVKSERDAWLSGGADDAGAGEVTVSMPGRVVKVMASVGQAVEVGEPVLIIEAMKMENEVKAARDGVVAVIHVAEGDSVEADAVLMEIGDA